MINYEILNIDPARKSVRVVYRAENELEYYTSVMWINPDNESELQESLANGARQARLYWNDLEEAKDYTLSSPTGQLADYNIQSQPTFNPQVESLSPTITKTPELITESWEIVPFSTDFLAASIKSKRTGLLAATDCYALSDRPMSAEMTAYRQALRDLPEQAGFPTDITWPIRPLD